MATAETNTATITTFASKLRSLRLGYVNDDGTVGLAVADVANAAGVSESMVRHCEAGSKRCGHETASAFDSALKAGGKLLEVYNRKSPAARTHKAHNCRRPRLLPAPPQLLGAEAVLDEITEAADTGAPVILTAGPGMGKTALALRWAHQQQDAHPDGILLLNGRGRAKQPPRTTAELLHQALDRLSSRGTRRGHDVDDLADQLRETLYYRRLLLVIDDARSIEQIEHLLGIPGVTTLVTSRNELPGLTLGVKAAEMVNIPPMDAPTATHLLTSIVGHRAQTHRKEVARIIDASDGTPLAIHAAARHILTHREQDMSSLADDLTGEHRIYHLHLAAGGHDHTDLSNGYEHSLRALGPQGRRLLRVATTGGPEFTLRDAARQAGITTTRARAHLTEATAEHLVATSASGHYRAPSLLVNYLHTNDFDD